MNFVKEYFFFTPSKEASRVCGSIVTPTNRPLVVLTTFLISLFNFISLVLNSSVGLFFNYSKIFSWSLYNLLNVISAGLTIT